MIERFHHEEKKKLNFYFKEKGWLTDVSVIFETVIIIRRRKVSGSLLRNSKSISFLFVNLFVLAVKTFTLMGEKTFQLMSK